jgi:hypothetical protein
LTSTLRKWLIGLQVLSASKRYPSSDIFNLSTEKLILNET